MYSALLSRKTLSQSLVTLSLFWKAQSVAWARRHTVYLERCVCCGNTVRETPIPWETLTLHVPWETASMYLERHLYHERPWHCMYLERPSACTLRDCQVCQSACTLRDSQLCLVPWETVSSGSVSVHVPWETVSSALYLERQSALSVCMCTSRDSQLCQCACTLRDSQLGVAIGCTCLVWLETRWFYRVCYICECFG